jgi:TolB-like protein
MALKRLLVGLSAALLCAVFPANSWAGQVVTKETRGWAKEALEQEQALQAIKARNSVAVLYFQNRTGQKELMPLQKGMALMLTTDLSKVRSLQVVERVRMQALVEELGLGVSGMVTPESAPRVGKLLQAYWLVGGDIAGEKAALQVHSDVLDVPSPKVVGQPTAEGKLAEFFALEKTLLFQIIKILGIKPTPEEEEELKKPLSTNWAALMALFEGVDASDEQQFDTAAGAYERALSLDPKLFLARDALNELQSIGLVKGKKPTTSGLLKSLRDRTSVTDAPSSQDDPTKRIHSKEPGSPSGSTPVDVTPIFPTR